MKKLSFSAKIAIASVLGVIVGLVLGEYATYFKIIGEIFINLINLMVPFLIFGAIIEAVMNLNFKELGTVGAKTLLAFVITSSLAGTFGLLYANLLKPGAGMTNVNLPEYTGNAEGMGLYEAILGFFPRNFFVSLVDNLIVQIIVFAIILGLTISYYKDNPSIRRVSNVVRDFNVFVMKVVTLIMVMAPYGIFAIMARMFGENGVGVLLPMAKFVGANTIANITVFIIVGLLVTAYGRLNYFRLLKNVRGSMIIAATTTSTAMALPSKMKESEENLGISKRISNFVNPLGGALNTDGGVILTTMAVMMVSQMMGIEMTIPAQLTVVATAVLSSFGNTMVPGGGIVAMAIVFNMNGIPLEAVVLFAGIDWFVAITRVVLNAVDDMFCALFVAISEKEWDRDVFYGRKKVVYEANLPADGSAANTPVIE